MVAVAPLRLSSAVIRHVPIKVPTESVAAADVGAGLLAGAGGPEHALSVAVSPRTAGRIRNDVFFIGGPRGVVGREGGGRGWVACVSGRPADGVEQPLT